MEAGLGAGADPIESMQWLREFGERYIGAWNAHDPEAVAACATTDVIWDDPGLPEPARGRDELKAFVRMGMTAFPHYRFDTRGEPAISDDRLVAYVPVRMSGTNSGPIEPPGFAPTGKSISFEAIDVWTFRGGLIWRYRAAYDFAGLARQLGLMPPRGGFAERAWIPMQRLRSKLPV